MIEKDKPDFHFAYEKANEILISSKTTKLIPFYVKGLIEEMSDIELRSYDYVQQKYNIDIRLFGSEDAVICEKNGNNIIFYNSRVDCHRKKISVLHEFGHYQLNHPILELNELLKTDFSKFKEVYGIYEVEANAFAAQLVMPQQVIKELSSRGKKISIGFLQEVFNVSALAAQKRQESLYKGRPAFSQENSYDDIVLMMYKDFINKIAPRKISYIKEFEDELEMEKIRQSWQ